MDALLRDPHSRMAQAPKGTGRIRASFLLFQWFASCLLPSPLLVIVASTATATMTVVDFCCILLLLLSRLWTPVPVNVSQGTALPGTPRKQHSAQRLRLPRKGGVLEEALRFGLSAWRRRLGLRLRD